MPPSETHADGNVKVDVEAVINLKVAELGKPIWSSDAIPAVDTNTPAREPAKKTAQAPSWLRLRGAAG